MNDFRNKLPLIFAIIFCGFIASFGILKLIRFNGMMRLSSCILIVLYILWLILESKIALTETDKGKTNADKGSCEAYAFGRGLTVFAALVFPTIEKSFMWVLIGLLVFMSGVFYRLYAIRTLGKFYSHRVRIIKDHLIVSNGPYQRVRHPAYTGMLIAHLGVVIFFFNWVALFSWSCILLPAIIVRIIIEEKVLFNLPGYSEYAYKRKRLIPGIW